MMEACREEVIGAYADVDYPLSSILVDLNVSLNTLYYFLNEWEVPRRHPNVTQDQIDRWIVMYRDQEMSTVDIAAVEGIAQVTVYNNLRNAIELRSQSEAVRLGKKRAKARKSKS